MTEKLIIVFGSASTQNAQHLTMGADLGRALAQAGYAVGTGGYRAVMDTVSRGAYQAGGHVIAYTTDEYPDEPLTPWHHEVRHTPSIHERLQQMLAEGDAFIATWGGVGTLAEIAVTWSVALVDASRGAHIKPLLLVGAHWPALLHSLEDCAEIGTRIPGYPVLMDTREEAVAYLTRYFAEDDNG